MKFRYWYLLILIFISSGFLWGKEFNIRGTVNDKETGEPLVGVNVVVKGTQWGCATDRDGYFELTIPVDNKRTVIVEFSYIGYYAVEKKVERNDLKTEELKILMNKSMLYMDEIVVTGTRTEKLLKYTPVTTQLIKEEDINDMGAADLTEVMSALSGISVTEDAMGTGLNSVEVQGFNSEHVLIMVDGVKLVGRVRGDLDISQIPVSRIKRIEIVKGASSAIYGSDAMGGVINIITKSEADNELHVDANLLTGSYGKLNSGLSVALPVAKWESRFSLDYRHYNGFDLDKSDVTEDGVGYDKYFGQFNSSRDFSKRFNLQVYAFAVNELKTRLLNSDFADEISNKRISGKIEAKYLDVLHTDIKTAAEYSYSEHHYDKRVIASDYLKKGAATLEELFKYELLLDKKLADHEMNSGFSAEIESMTSDRIENGYQSSVLHNIFFQDEWKLSRTLTLLNGIRMDIHSVYGTEYSPKSAVMLSLNNHTRLRISYAQGFRAPSFKELYYDFQLSETNLSIVGNTELHPEESQAFNIDFETWTTHNYHSRLNFYFNDIKNLIDYSFLGNDGIYSVYQVMNRKSAKTWGMEWEMQYSPLKAITLTMGYTYLDSRDETTDEPLGFKSKHRGQASLQFNIGNMAKVNLRGQFIGEKFYRDDDTGEKHRIAGYNLYHMNISFKEWAGFNIKCGIKNITDYVDIIWGPMPGREFYAGINYNLNRVKLRR